MRNVNAGSATANRVTGTVGALTRRQHRSARAVLRRLLWVLLLAAVLTLILPRVYRAVAEEAQAPATMYITVQTGDTLWGIASRLQDGGDPRRLVEEMRRLNDLDGAGLYPGQRLRLPPGAVADGATVGAAARKE